MFSAAHEEEAQKNHKYPPQTRVLDHPQRPVWGTWEYLHLVSGIRYYLPAKQNYLIIIMMMVELAKTLFGSNYSPRPIFHITTKLWGCSMYWKSNCSIVFSLCSVFCDQCSMFCVLTRRHLQRSRDQTLFLRWGRIPAGNGCEISHWLNSIQLHCYLCSLTIYRLLEPFTWYSRQSRIRAITTYI